MSKQDKQYFMKKPFRILSLDGGGSWAVIQAVVLGRLYGENTPGHKILKEADLVVGSSTGSLILAGLLCNKTPGEIVAAFTKEGLVKQLFPSLLDCEKNIFTLVGNWIGQSPRYSGERKKESIREFLGDDGERFLSDFPSYLKHPNLHILFPHYDYLSNRTIWCKSSSGTQSQMDAKSQDSEISGEDALEEVRLADAVNGATQLPSPFFDNPAVVLFYRRDHYIPRYVWDSTLTGFFNPVMAAVTEAISMGAEPTDIAVTSIGTGTLIPFTLNDGESAPLEKAFYFAESLQPSNFTNLQRFRLGMLQRPPDAATSMAWSLLKSLSGNETMNFFRFNPVIRGVKDGSTIRPPKGFSEKEFKRLLRLNVDVRKPDDMDLIVRFAQEWMRDDSEIHNQCLSCKGEAWPFSGHKTFHEALSAWKTRYKSPSDFSA